MGEMKRANAREERQRTLDRFTSTIVIAAAVIAAVRLSGDENLSGERVSRAVRGSVLLARMILEEALGIKRT
jgi:hypothetical protein